MSLFAIATTAHFAGSVVLALFFLLLRRYDRRAYLRDWMAAWMVQAAALAVLLVVAVRDWHLGFSVYLFLETAHGLLLVLAARSYHLGLSRWTLGPRLLLLLPLAGWAAIAPVLFTGEHALHAAQYVALAATALAAAAALWPQRAGGMGVRLTTTVLAILGLVHLAHAGFFLRVAQQETSLHPLLEVAPFQILLLQTVLALSMVLTVMEAAQFALKLSKTELEAAQKKLETLAETDPLTGCYNRRVFRNLVDELRAAGGKDHGVVVLLDMDGLKVLNDQEGHAAGDAAIRTVAEAIRSVTRTTDVTVRWGGDEFVVVMQGGSAADAAQRRDQIVAAVAAAGHAVSAGFAPYGGATDIMAAVDEADRVMYAAKAERKRAPASA